MRLKGKKITFDTILSVCFVLFVIAYMYSTRVKTWVLMGLMTIGLFKPSIPVHPAGEKLTPAPFMQVYTADKKMVDLQQQKGKVVFINIWVTWCPPCRAELPSINDLYLKVKDNPNIVFLSVDADNNLPKSALFLQKNGYRFPLYGGVMDLPREVYSGTIPTTLVINKKGFVVFNHVNRANYAGEKFVDYLLALSRE